MRCFNIIYDLVQTALKIKILRIKIQISKRVCLSIINTSILPSFLYKSSWELSALSSCAEEDPGETAVVDQSLRMGTQHITQHVVWLVVLVP